MKLVGAFAGVALLVTVAPTSAQAEGSGVGDAHHGFLDAGALRGAADDMRTGSHSAPATLGGTVPLMSGSVTDPAGDADRGEGDIVGTSVGLAAGIMTMTMKVATFESPFSVNWRREESYIAWYFDVDFDGEGDFAAAMFNDGQDNIVAGVVKPNGDVCTPATPSWDANSATYRVAAPVGCLDDPAAVNWYAEIEYQYNATQISHDEAPDAQWAGPILNDAYAPPVDPTSTGLTQFLAVTPARLLDSRGLPSCVQAVHVAGQAGVPGNAVAAALTITVPGASAAGYATAWPDGAAQPNASNLNYAAGETRANSSIVRLSDDGWVDVHTSTCEPVLVDVSGAFVPAAGPVTAGRFVAQPPHRVYDARLAVGQGLTLSPAQLGVPAGASAVAVNITVGDTTTAGFVTAWPNGFPQPNASILNADGSGQTRAAAGVLPLGTGGLDIAQNIGGRVIVDVTGYFTGAADAASTSGLFQPSSPARILDTRPTRISGWTAVPGVPAQAAAIATNVTITDPASSGWLTIAPNGQGDVNATSSVNATSGGESIANLAIVPSNGGISIAAGGTQAAALVDLAGWFTT